MDPAMAMFKGMAETTVLPMMRMMSDEDYVAIRTAVLAEIDKENKRRGIIEVDVVDVVTEESSKT